MTLFNKKGIVVAMLSGALMPSMASAFSLEQAVALSLSEHPEIRSAYNDFRSRVEESDAAFGNYLPSVDLSAGVGWERYDDDRRTETDYNPHDVTVSIRQLIWDGSYTINDIRRTSWEAEAQRYQLIADAQDKALRVTEVYLDVLKSRDLLELSEANFEVHQKIYADIKRRTESGIGSLADQVQVEARIARAQSNLAAAHNNLLDSETNYIRVVGQAPEALYEPEVDQTALPLTLEDALATAESEHPRISVATTDINAARYQYDSRQSAFLPTFTIEASQQWGEELDGSVGKTDETSAMLRMNWNLYNGGSDLAESRRSAYQVEKSQDIRDNALRMLNEGVRLSWSALQLTFEQREFLKQHVDASAETVIAYEKQFRIGKRTLLDVLNTENELFEARQSYITAHYDQILAEYRVLNSTGSLLSAMRVDMPESWLEPVIE
uniref:TolC family outer membrane protein n=1 Tax=Thaumasiovibrio occultus TaxID=1891184 RepID=UPI000B36089C|nr:TolC family outer membrane protein [Thaumasiovibrio occultus]